MKRIATNMLAALVVAGGGLYLAATPAQASTAVQATCGPLSGECCKYDGSTCACGPCKVILAETVAN